MLTVDVGLLAHYLWEGKWHTEERTVFIHSIMKKAHQHLLDSASNMVKKMSSLLGFQADAGRHYESTPEPNQGFVAACYVTCYANTELSILHSLNLVLNRYLIPISFHSLSLWLMRKWLQDLNDGLTHNVLRKTCANKADKVQLEVAQNCVASSCQQALYQKAFWRVTTVRDFLVSL